MMVVVAVASLIENLRDLPRSDVRDGTDEDDDASSTRTLDRLHTRRHRGRALRKKKTARRMEKTIARAEVNDS